MLIGKLYITAGNGALIRKTQSATSLAAKATHAHPSEREKARSIAKSLRPLIHEPIVATFPVVFSGFIQCDRPGRFHHVLHRVNVNGT